MLLDCYVELIYFTLSIPIIYILYVSSLITKETAKRERDRKYCKKDIMEMETMRYYVSNGDRKNLLKNMNIAAIIFITVIIISALLILFVENDILEHLIIFVILLILAVFLFLNISKLSSQKTTEYDNKMIDLRKYVKHVLLGLERDSSNEPLQSFSKLPDKFLIPFVERWTFMENINNIKTFKNLIKDIDASYYDYGFENVNSFIGLLRPHEQDIMDIYKAVKSSQKVSFPDLTEYEFIYRKNTSIEIIAWIILVFIYFNIFHIYYLDTDMFVEIITAIIISILFLMIMYYMIIAKEEL